MKILVAGGGGREHAIVSALCRNNAVELYSVMGKKNPGIAKLAKEVFLHAETNVEAVVDFAKKHNIK